MNKTLKFGIIFLTGALLFTACRQSRHEGFEESETGLYYAIHKENPSGKKGKEGDIMFCSMTLTLKGAEGKKDSLIFNSDDAPDYPGGIKFIQVLKPEYEGDLMEGIANLHVGDSASFIVSSDSFFIVSNKLKALPPGINPGSELLFTFGVKDFKSREETIKLVQNLQMQQSAMNQEKMNQLRDSEADDMKAYLERKNITEKPTASGLVFVQNEKGNGSKPKKGQKVTVNYSGYLLNGKKFDSSYDRNEPITFTLGQGEVIAGWDEGIGMMNVGGTATFVIPSVLAYGSNGQGDIPPFAPLVFEVQLLKAE
jgi:FKBP-type peptidyl-prolyl cis-trans isomerase FkpA